LVSRIEIVKDPLNQILIAIAGKDFCVVAADTRISQGYNILSRTHSKTTRLTDKCVITSGGMVADIETLHKLLIAKVKTYERTFKRTPSIESLAQLLGNTLYGRRFMPYYAFNLLCGLDQNGQGIVYGYDAIGSFDKLTYGVQGSGSQLGAPILDNQFVDHNFLVKQLAQDLTTVEETAKDIINSIAERDIFTGDGVEIVIIDAHGVHVKREAIRRD
jgi:20S proteasome subunit beta 6